MSLYNYIHWLDYGVKGQMRGKHLMARDPEYLARLKGGLAKHNVSKVVPTRPTVNNVSVENLFNFKSKARKKARELLSSDDVSEQKRGEAIRNKLKRRIEQRRAFLEGRHEAKKKRRALQEAKRQNRLKWIKRGKIGAVLGGLGLIGAGIGYAKHKGAFDSNYNVLKFKRKDSMNTYQKIKFLKFRRHMDALRIKRLRRFGDISTGVSIVGGIVGGSALALILAKIMDRLGYEADIASIREGSAIPEKEYVRRFKIYFNGGHGLFRKYMNPGVYSGMTDVDFYDYAKKVDRAKTVSDLCVLFPKHEQLRRIAAAYKEARAAGLY